jgi:signal transduction histidine kinase
VAGRTTSAGAAGRIRARAQLADRIVARRRITDDRTRVLPEVRALAAAFNDMAVRLERLLRSQNESVADASHQLRTPLTALRLRLENLGRDVGPPGEAELAGALAEVERRVRDEGPGMTPDDRSRAFDRFWRGCDGEGSGLGLAIVRRLVEADGGTVELHGDRG